MGRNIIPPINLWFVAIVIAGVVLMASSYQPTPGQPYLATNQPAGLYYNGPETTALAGYYCIEAMNSSNGYSIQLTALLDNGEWAQVVYSVPPVGQPGLAVNVWDGAVLLHAVFVPINAPCAWLIISINNNVLYVGYSLDGKDIVWFDEYKVGYASIEPGPSTELVLGGYGLGAQAQLGNGTLVRLALYYWGNNGWEPAPAGVFSVFTNCSGRCASATEAVGGAWVFTNGTCGGVVSWPNPVNETVCPVPVFEP
jgi:hypothetical protein